MDYRAVLAGLALAGCTPGASPPAVQPQAVAVAIPPEPKAEPPSKAPEPLRPPKGYVEMKPLGVGPTADGMAVLLGDSTESVVVPIFIGGTEALSIRLRLDRKPFERPLTHDLLDAAVRELGGEFVKVHVDDLKNNIFIGRVFLRKDKRVFDLDARPSDAVAIAIGNGIPIYVAQKVIDAAGIHRDSEGNMPKTTMQARPRPELLARAR